MVLNSLVPKVLSHSILRWRIHLLLKSVPFLSLIFIASGDLALYMDLLAIAIDYLKQKGIKIH
jgi:hypothetical protein